jgi:hypothetical protein
VGTLARQFSIEKAPLDLSMAPFAPGDVVSMPEERNADERFAEDENQHQISPGHCGEPRAQWLADQLFFKTFILRM